MKKFRHIYFTGCMGAGKSTVGELAALKLGREFVDLDRYIEEREGLSVDEIFSRYGEEGFRERETRALKSLPERPLLIATGGGIVLSEENRRIMKERGAVIYLEVGVDELVRRLETSTERPLLKDGDLKGKITAILKEREPFYRDYTYKIDVGTRTPLQIVKELINWLKI